jgi:acetyl esterase/lipase
VGDCTSGHDAAAGLISLVFADLSGLPPLIIQAGTHEVLLDITPEGEQRRSASEAMDNARSTRPARRRTCPARPIDYTSDHPDQLPTVTATGR